MSDDKKHAAPDLDPELDEEEDDMKRAPTVVRQGLAECLGTFLLVLLGDGAIAQYKMQSKQNGQQGGNSIGYKNRSKIHQHGAQKLQKDTENCPMNSTRH